MVITVGADIVLSVGSALVAGASSLGGKRSTTAEKFSRGWYIKLGLCIAAWFASSAICSFGTKRSLNSLAPYSCASGLTALQFVIAAAVGGVLYLATGERMVPGIMPDVFRVAMAYTLGFLFFNMSYGRLSASFAETVRGMEPLFAFTLARLLGARGGTLSSTSVMALACLLLGGAVSCYAQQFDAVGLVLGLAANTCFAGRSILVSQLQDKLRRRPLPLAPNEGDAGPGERCDSGGGGGGGGGAAMATARMRPELSAAGMFFYQHALGLALMVPGALYEDSRCAERVALPETAHYAVTSSLAFFAYNQLSLVALLMLNAVTHSVANSCRRCVTILSAATVFGTAVSPLGSAGVALVIGSAVTYALSEGRFLDACVRGRKQRGGTPMGGDVPVCEEEVRLRATPTTSSEASPDDE